MNNNDVQNFKSELKKNLIGICVIEKKGTKVGEMKFSLSSTKKKTNHINSSINNRRGKNPDEEDIKT